MDKGGRDQPTNADIMKCLHDINGRLSKIEDKMEKTKQKSG